MLDRLVAGGSVSAKQMRAVLDDRLWHSYQERLQQSRWEREMAETGKEIFAEYNRKLRVANMLYGRCEQISAKGSSAKAIKFSNRIDGLYEAAIETLQETLAADRSAEMYIEAGYSDNPNLNTISLCPDGMPRMIYRMVNIASRDECKIRTLTEAIADTDNIYGIGTWDFGSAILLDASILSARLNQKRIENIQSAKQTKKSAMRSHLLKRFFN